MATLMSPRRLMPCGHVQQNLWAAFGQGRVIEVLAVGKCSDGTSILHKQNPYDGG